MPGKIIYTLLICFLLSNSVFGQERNTDYQYALIEAVKQKNIGNLPGAIELYKMVIEANDSVAVAYYELGTLFALTRDETRARHYLEKAYNLDPENKWYFEAYMDFLMHIEDVKSAGKILKAKLKDNSDNVDLTFRQANVLYMKGKTKKAIRTLNNIEENRGFSDRVSLMKANIYEKEKKFDKALDEVEKIIQVFPESVEFMVVAAELAMKSKNSELAAEYYKSVFELDSINIFAITNLTDYYRDQENLEESFYYLNKSFDSDEIDYNKKIAILSYYLTDNEFNIKHSNLLEPLLNTLMLKYPEKRDVNLLATDFFIQNRKYNEALDALLPVLNIEEKKYQLWKQGVLLANATNRTKDMYTISSLANRIFPDSSVIVYFKGAAEFELEKFDSTILTLSNESFLNGSDREIVLQSKILLAEAYNKLKDFDKSDSLFRAIVAGDPTNYLVMNNFSYYLSIRDYSLEEALELSQKTILANPENGTFLDTYAWILFKMNRYEEAEHFIQKALRFGGENDPDVNEHAAEINRALGSIHLAKTFWEKAIILGGDKERLSRKLEEIQVGDEL